MRPGRTHYVPPNAVTRVPRNVVYLDSEAVQHEEQGARLQTFRLAVAAYDHRHHHRDGWGEREWSQFTNTDDLWSWIDARCQRKARTVLVAHKLDYDMRITDSLTELPKRGWSLRGIGLDGAQAWASWRHDGRSLMMCDSLSWLNMGLERVGALIGQPKLDLPAWEDSDEAWFARCRRDVEIMAEAYRRILDWVRTDDLGNWKPTGAGQAWAAYRHRFMEHRLLVHESEDAREAERRAAHTGRCEAWSWGKLNTGPFVEYDYSTAYTRIGADSNVPTRLIGETGAVSTEQYDKLARRWRVLADVTVHTEVETVPMRKDDRIVWPTGTFTTTLWDTEIALARDYGATVAVDRAWWYKGDPALRAFCTWCLDMLDDRNTEVDPVVRAAVKHWSRALIGRFAARWSSWEQYGLSPVSDVALGWAHDVSAGEKWRLMQIGAQLMRETERHDSNDAVVSIMSWVMAEARSRLWRSADLAGFDNVVYMDTDSLIVTRPGELRLLEADVPGLRRKSVYDTLELLGPRQIVTQGLLRASGVPRGAVRVEGDQWEADVWSQLDTSIAHREASTVRITPRRLRLRGTDKRRQRLPGGRTIAHHLDVSA